MESPPTTVSTIEEGLSERSGSSQDSGDSADSADSITDESSISPSDSVSNHGNDEDMEVVPENLDRIPRIARRTVITTRLLQLQLKSNQLTIMFNDESTYKREKNDEPGNNERNEWIQKCIEVINDAQKVQCDILDYHLGKHKKREMNLDGIASLELIEEWMEKIAATWARTHHQLRLYAFLHDNQSEDAETLVVDVRRLFCLLIQESFLVIEPPPKVIVLRKQFDTAVVSLLPKMLSNIEFTAKASIVDMDQFYRDHHTQSITPGEFYKSPNGIMENDELTLKMAQSDNYIRFQNMILHLFNRKDAKECVFDSKYHLLYQLIINFPDFDMLLSCRFISNYIIVVEPNQETIAWAIVTWRYEFPQTIYSMINREISTPWNRAFLHMLNRAFRRILRMSLTLQDSYNLACKVFNLENPIEMPNNQLTWSLMVEQKLPDRQFTFWEWFYSSICLIKDALKDYWNHGCRKIIGYINREKAERMLMAQPPGTFLLRFSDSRLGAISIAYVTETAYTKKVYMIKPFTRNDLIQRSLADRLSDLDYLTHLYPGVCKHIAFGKFYSDDPGQRLSSDGYAELILKPKLPVINDR